MKKVHIDFERLKGALSGKQREIAKKIGVTQATLSYKVNRHRKMTLEELNVIAGALERNTTDFLIFEDEEAA